MYFIEFNFITTIYIRKIKDEDRIMSQATNKEVITPLGKKFCDMFT